MSMEDYSAKKAALDLALEERRSLISKLQRVVAIMTQHTDKFHFKYLESAGLSPDAVMTVGKHAVEPGDWASDAEIQSVFVAWHVAFKNADEAWKKLTPEQQRSMKPPTPFYDPQRQGTT